MISDILKKHIDKSLSNLSILCDSYILEHPGDITNGDFSTNVALIVSKQEQKSPKALADLIVSELCKQNIKEVEKIEVAGPGFINFFLSKDFFKEAVFPILTDKKSWGKNMIYQNKNFLIEHSSPNLFKPFHIGHMMNNAIGESVSRIVKNAGAHTTTISYPSDVSLGIGKAIYALMQKGGIEKINSFRSLDEKLTFLGECYVLGTKIYEDNPETHTDIKRYTEDIFLHRNTESYQSYLVGRDINLEYFKNIAERLGSVFDGYIFESEAGGIGKELVLKYTPQIYTQSDGAIIYKGEDDNLHTRVFINKEGYPTYEAKDTGLLALKFDRYHPDISIFVTDHEQKEYFKVVSTAAGKINKEWQEKTIHLTHGRMSFKGQKMSSRLGGVPLAVTLLETVKEDVLEKSKQLLTEKDREAIAISAIKFSILRVQAGKNINFDPEISLSFEGDSGPYLQYSAIRAFSLIGKAQESKILFSPSRPDTLPVEGLERLLYRFLEVTELSAREFAPHHIVIYLLQLAGEFNSLYGRVRILENENASYYISLTQAFAYTMENGLNLLGISLPTKM